MPDRQPEPSIAGTFPPEAAPSSPEAGGLILAGNSLLAVEQALPHHGEQCWNVDNIVEYDPGKSLTAEWRPGTERFSDKNVDPMQLIEFAAQAAVMYTSLEAENAGLAGKQQVVLFGGVPEATFRNSRDSAEQTFRVQVRRDGEGRKAPFEAEIFDASGDEEPVCAVTIAGRQMSQEIFLSKVLGNEQPDSQLGVMPLVGRMSRLIDHGLLYRGIIERSLRCDPTSAVATLMPHRGNFSGHLRLGRVLQGVQQVRALQLTAQLHQQRQSRSADSESLPTLVGLQGAEFAKPVIPGQALQLAVERQADSAEDGPVAYRGTITKAGGVVACHATLLFARAAA